MIKYSLKEVFYGKKENNNILSEMGIITQSDFALRLLQVLEKKPELINDQSPLTKVIVDTTKKEHISAKSKRKDAYAKFLKDKGKLTKDDKKLKKDLSSKLKSAEAAIHEAIISLNIKNDDGEVIDFMKIKPLYESLLDYLETAGDINIDDCIKAADYYMRNFYRIATEEDKDQIDRGNFNFKTVFKRTNYFQDYLDDSLPPELDDIEVRNNIVKLYEDEDVEVVFPLTNPAFLSYISDKEGDLTWCTRKPRTWISYNKRQLVAIAHDKKTLKGDLTYLISLKIGFDGSILYEESCDYKNQHMTKEQIQQVISAAGEEEIKKVVSENGLRIKGVPENLEKHFRNLVQLNDIEELKKLFYKIIEIAGVDEGVEENFGLLYKCFQEIHDESKALELYQEIMFTAATEYTFLTNEDLINITNMDLAFSPVEKRWLDFRQDYLNFALSKKIRRKSICLNFFLESMVAQDSSNINFSTEDLNSLIKIGLKEKNVALFKRIVSNLITYLGKLDNATINVIQESFSNIVTSRGFKSYFGEAKLDMFNYKPSSGGNDLSAILSKSSLKADRLDAFLLYLAVQNKDVFMEENLEAFEEAEISPEMLDYQIVRGFIDDNISTGLLDITKAEDIEKLNNFNYPSFVLRKEDFINIIKNIYNDFESFREIAQNDKKFMSNILAGLSIRLRRNQNVKELLNQDTSIVELCVNNTTEIINNMTSGKHLYISSLLKYVFLDEDNKLQSVDQETKRNVLKIIFNVYEDFNIPRYNDVVRNLGQTCATNKKVLNDPGGNEYQLFEKVISEDIISIEAKQVIMCTFLVAFLSVRGGLSSSNNQLMHNFANLFRQKGVAEQYINTIQTTDNAFSPFLSAMAIINLTAPFLNNSYYQKVIDLYLKDLSSSKVEYHLNDCPSYQDITIYLYQDLSKHIVDNGLINSTNFNMKENYTKLFEGNGPNSSINASLVSSLLMNLIKSNIKINTGYDKQVLESIIRDDRILSLDSDDIKLILTNFTLHGEDGDGLSLEERVQIRKLYLDMFKRQSQLKKYSDFALELARQTDKVTQKHLAMVFPSAKDLMEKMLRQYIRMLLS